jgi:hypothetical protein
VVSLDNPFLTSSPRTVLATFTAHGSLELPSFQNFFQANERPCNGQSMFDCHMAPFAENERLSLEGNHPFNPFRFFPSWVFMEFSHRLYVMYFYIFATSAVLAKACKKTLYKLCSIAVELRRVIL